MKVCVGCNSGKALSEFNVDKSTTDGYCRRCRACSNIFRKEWLNRNAGKARTTRRAWRLKNIEKCRARNRKYIKENRDKAREWNRRDRKRNPERIQKYLQSYYQKNSEEIRARINRIRKQFPEEEAGRQTEKRYGLDLQGYKNLLSKQSGCCAICGRKDPGVPGRKRLFVDHDHVTLDIRGLLCYRCNTGCGNFKDSSRILELAAKYLEAPPNHALGPAGDH